MSGIPENRPSCIFTHNTMSKIFSDNTTMSGIHENPRIDTKNANISLLRQKWYQFIVWPWTNGGHLGFFTQNAMSKIFSDNFTMSGIHENPRIDTKNANMPLLCRKWYQFIDWPWSNGFFTHNATSKIFSDNATVSGILQNPIIHTKNMNLPLLC